jgi:multidrug efflux pump subunit AcrA (membrane-fusion protein)
MSIALNQARPVAVGRSIRRALPWALTWLCLALLAGYVALDLLNPTRLHASQGQSRETAPAGKAVPEAQKATPASASSVSLSESKYQQAKIATEPARIDRLATEVGVPGMIQANADQKVEVRPRAAGIVRSVHAAIGQVVKRGDILVILDSPEVGKARLDLRARQRELATAQYEAKWKSDIAANVKALIPELEKGIAEDIANRHKAAGKDHHDEEADHQKGTPARSEAIEIKFAGKDLGTYRGTLLQAFADYEIAVHEEEKNIDLQRKTIVGAHPVVVARHTREGVQEKLKGAIEQVRYDAAQEQRIAVQALKQAEAAVVDAAQRLRILDVAVDIPRLLEHPEEGNALAAIEDVTRYDIAAPFDGNIVKKFPFAARGQKADMNDVLFVVADLRTVWVKAEVSESDVSKLSRLQDGTIRFRAARAYPGREFQARLISVGSVVDPQTRTVPILAEAENPDGLLKAEMFAQIILDSSAVEEALTVPSAAVVEKDGATFVFVPDGKPRTFTIKPVEAGRQAGDRTVIKAGLRAGDVVVSSGAFFLKSELILQNEPEEE